MTLGFCLTSALALMAMYALIGCFTLDSRVFASQGEEVTIKGGSARQGVILIDAELGSHAVQLECFLTSASCKIPRNGGYHLTRIAIGKGLYEDCHNVRVYRIDHGKESRAIVGEYCLLEK